MIQSFEWLIALRYLRSKRKESFISVVTGFSLVGIVLGVATLIVVMSVMNGFHKQFLSHVLGIQGHITLAKANGVFQNHEDLITRLNKIPDITYVAPLVIGQGMATSQSDNSGVIVRGMTAADLKKKPMVYESMNDEELDNFKEGKGVILGISLAQKLNVRIGDAIKIVAPDSTNTVIGNIPRIKTFPVIGLFDVGLYQYNSSTIFMPLSDAQIFFKKYDAVTEIEIMLKNPEQLQSIKKQISPLVGDDVKLIDWQKSQEKFFKALEVERTVMFLILTLIILVAALNIISGLIMLVKEKSTNIAILRTMGASKASIIRIFIISGSMIGIIGTFLGVILGISFAMNIERIKTALESITGTNLFDPVVYFLTTLPSDLEISSVIKVASMSLIFSVLATVYPAWRASRLTPAEILRYN
jgi:lipoprotein-releasing system permease protein